MLLADRTMVEQGSDAIIDEARDKVVSFLVVGDPLGATTHTDLVLRAVEKNIPYKIIHNASILNSIGCCGLQLYAFGETISICFWSEGWRPSSYLLKAAENRRRGLHTLCLLDIKVKEKSVENLIRGREIYEPPRYMTVAQACAQIMEIVSEEEKTPELDDLTRLGKEVITAETICVGLARVGKDDQLIRVDTLANLVDSDLGDPLHSLIIAGKLHPMEVEFLKMFYKNETCSLECLVDSHNKFYK